MVKPGDRIELLYPMGEGKDYFQKGTWFTVLKVGDEGVLGGWGNRKVPVPFFLFKKVVD